MNEDLNKNSTHNKRKSQLLPIIAVVGTVTAIKAVNNATVKPASKLIRLLFKGIYPGPKNYDEIKKSTLVIKDIDYGSNIENGIMDINMHSSDLNEKKPLIVLLHGGGFIGGSKESTAAYARTLASYGYIVANVDYAYAPEHTYPTPIIQLNRAIEYLKENAEAFHIDINNVFIAGGSAGAQIASQFAAIQTNDTLAVKMKVNRVLSKEQLKGVILFCGLYNMDNVIETGFPWMQEYLWAYTGEKDFKKYEKLDEISTVKQITESYPPTFITVGNKDELESQSMELIEVLKSKGIKHTAVLFNDSNKRLMHQYQFMLWLKDSLDTLEKLVAFIKENTR